MTYYNCGIKLTFLIAEWNKKHEPIGTFKSNPRIIAFLISSRLPFFKASKANLSISVVAFEGCSIWSKLLSDPYEDRESRFAKKYWFEST